MATPRDDISFALAGWELPAESPTRKQKWALHRFGLPNYLVQQVNREQAEQLLDICISVVAVEIVPDDSDK